MSNPKLDSIINAPAEIIKHLFETKYVSPDEFTPEYLLRKSLKECVKLAEYIPIGVTVQRWLAACSTSSRIEHMDKEWFRVNSHAFLMAAAKEGYDNTIHAILKRYPATGDELYEFAAAWFKSISSDDSMKEIIEHKLIKWDAKLLEILKQNHANPAKFLPELQELVENNPNALKAQIADLKKDLDVANTMIAEYQSKLASLRSLCTQQ